MLGCKSRTDRKVFCFFRYLRSVLPWHFFPGRRGAAEAASFRSWGANLQKIAKLFCFFCYLRSSALGSFLWVAREGSSSRASRSKIAEDRKLYVFIVTSDLLQFVPLFDLQNQDNPPGFRISKTLPSRGTKGGCKAFSQRMPCTKCHLQINIQSPSKVLEPRKKKHNYWLVASNVLKFVKVRS